MSTSNDGPIDELVQERWREIGLSQTDLAEVLRAGSGQAGTSVNGSARVDVSRLMTVAEVLGVASDILNPQAPPAVQARAKIQAAASLQSLLELRMLRVFRELQDPDARRILIELAEQIVKRQTPPPQAG